MSDNNKHVIILGAGPAGLATGHEVSAHGGRVTVLERNDFVGGLCRTVHVDGYRFDLGGHRWFTKNEALNDWFRRLLEGELVDVERISRIYYDGKYFFYPIRFGDLLRKTGPLTILHAGFAFLWAVFQQAVLPKPVVNMQQAYCAQFGSKLYEMFFRQYTEKVWGRPCEELSSDWVSQRSKGLSIWSVVREALVGNKEQLTSLIDEFMYPRYGYMRVPERMAEDITARGGEIHLQSTVTRVIYHGPNDVEVRYRRDDGEHSIRGTDVVSTIPLGVLARILEPECNQHVAAVAGSLEFRDLITVNLKLRRRQVSRDTWLYIQDADILFGRMHEPKNWSRDMVPDDDHTSLVLECFCSKGDGIWNMSDDEIQERCVRDLVDKLKFINDDEVEGANIIRTRETYPIYDLEYADKIATINAYLKRFTGVHIVGRGGTFRYNNSDHSIEMGLLLGQRLLGHKVDHLAVNTERNYHEIKSGEEPARDSYGNSATAHQRTGSDAR
ncbi:MAG: FAD-dependent oxidoreductase [Pseudomonadota bacterium]